MKNIQLIILSSLLITSCAQKELNKVLESAKLAKDTIYTQPSNLKNQYVKFSSPRAINRIAEIENEYFKSYYDSLGSKYYGTAWRENAENEFNQSDSIDNFSSYLLDCSTKPDSMHCTIYAVEALRFGLSGLFEKLELLHKALWGDREHAGWSIAYLLTKYYNWKAVIVVSKESPEYKSCIQNFKNNQKYHVWKQPNIPIETLFVIEDHAIAIDSLLNENEFGWGFSYQGYHTWITRFDVIKECNWLGAPSLKYSNGYNIPLFRKHKFTEYMDYASHVIVFPPKILLKN